MRFDDPRALAQEFRRRGWKWIASYIELWDELPIAVEAQLYISDGQEYDFCIDDPFSFFTIFLRKRERDGEIADATLSAMDEFLETLVAELTAPGKHRLH